jgi:ADP-ribosylglycohydrolase/fructose-1,6-bisphosphatase/inositol monophosphatase family enzyme
VNLGSVLAQVIALVEQEGAQLRAEFHRPGGPRGARGKAPIDVEIEERLRAKLQALVPCDFLGEETGLAPGTLAGYRWLVDPQDGTSEFLNGRRGSSVSVALLRVSVPVLGVVHSPNAPDRGPDTIAWAEGAGPILRNGVPIESDLSRRRLERGEFLWATASSGLRPETFARAAAPARTIAMPSIAYRLARVAAGDGAATVSIHGVNEYDIAAGMALVRAARGVLLDAEGREIVLTGGVDARLSGCFAGAPAAAAQLARFDWRALEREPKRELRVALQFPRRMDDARLARAQGCLLGQLIGDSLGSLVEFRSAAEIARAFPRGVRELADGGAWSTIAGQPTDDSELALSLGRTILARGGYDAAAAFESYREWLQSRPFDVGATTRRGIEGRPDAESQSNGSLMRVSPIGIWAAGDPARAARAAREDSALTHPNPVCQESCAAYAAAIAAGVAGASREAILQAALGHASKTHAASTARNAIERGAGGKAPEDFMTHQGWVLIALQNAFHQLFSASSVEEALVATVGAGGDTDTNAAIAGALLGAAQGREAFPSRWILPLLACRPLAVAGAQRPRPSAYWPDDALDLAEALVGK